MFIFAKISKKRRLVNIVASALFIIAAFFILLFTFGYRFRQGIFIYSGTITVKTVPKKIDIYLNGKLKNKKTYDIINNAYNLNGIKPGKYTLEIKKDGYSSWKKDIRIHSGIATEFWNIILTPLVSENKRLDIISPAFFKNSEGSDTLIYSTKVQGPMNIFCYFLNQEVSFKIFEDIPNRKYTANLNLVEFSPSKNKAILGIEENNYTNYYLAYLDKIEKDGINSENLIKLSPALNAGIKSLNENTTINSANLNTSQLKANSDQIKTAQSFTSAKSSVEEGTTTKVNFTTDVLTKSNTLEEKNKLLEFSSFKWLDDNNLDFMQDNNLYALNTDQEKLTLVLKNIRGYQLSQENIYYVQAPFNLIFKKSRYNTQNQQITENYIDQDFKTGETPFYKLFVYDDKRIALLNQKNKLYLYNDNQEEYQIFKKLNDDVQGVQFSNDGKKLLYFTDNQIWVYYLREWDVQPKNKVGAHRLIYEDKQNKIYNATWHKSYQYVFFSTNQKVQMIEIDSRSNINLATVLNTEVTNPSFIYDTPSEKMFWLDNSDKYIQLFETDIASK